MTTNAHSSAAAPSPFAPPPEVVEDAYSVPAFSPEDEQRERQSLTEEERRRIIADLCGLADGMAGLRVSTAGGAERAVDGECTTSGESAATLRTPAEIERDMNLLNAELDAIPHDEKEAYLLALLHCPDQVFCGWRGEVIVEMQQQEGAGGRGTVFDAKQTAGKMVEYWQRRYEAFGEDLAFKPMTLAGAMEEELGTMTSFSMHRISPCKDAAGRTVVVCTPRRRIRSLYPAHRQKRASWYVLECLAQDPEVRQKGAVMIFDGNGIHPGLFDPKFVRWALGSFDLFPIQWKAMHFVNTNVVTNRVVVPSLKFLMKKERRNRLLVHSGKTRTQTLAQYRLPPECLPADLNIGGTVEMDIVKWVRDRYSIEGANLSESAGGDDDDDMEEGDSPEPTPKRSKMTPPTMLSTMASSTTSLSNWLIGNGSYGPSQRDQSRATAENIVFTKEEADLLSHHTGRKTDERMARAIVLCLRDPDIDKTEALLTAGFHYVKEGKVNEKKLFDAEGVSLRQRKNQLRRRLKLIAEKQKEDDEADKKVAITT